jgi:hypothetical protein
MDFDSIIPLLIFIVFVGLPAIFRKIRGKKNSEKSAYAKTRKISLFDRISEKIQGAIREAEQQRQQNRQEDSYDTVKKPESLWEILAEEEKAQEAPHVYKKPEPDLSQTVEFDSVLEPEETEKSQKVILEEEKKVVPVIKAAPACYLSGQYELNSGSQLRQAIVWAEILAKPVSLRAASSKGIHRK